MLAATFSYLPALLGGVAIGIASLVAVAVTGKIPGISGLFSRVLRPRRGDTAWRLVFLAGLIAGAAAAFALSDPAALFQPARPLAWFVVAGVLVGFGTRLGGGCTSGHGVCGIGMGSKSASIATLVFMIVAIVTVYVAQHGPWGIPL